MILVGAPDRLQGSVSSDTLLVDCRGFSDVV